MYSFTLLLNYKLKSKKYYTGLCEHQMIFIKTCSTCTCNYIPCPCYKIWQAHSADKETAYVEFFKELTRRTARLVADWQSVGWCHG